MKKKILFLTLAASILLLFNFFKSEEVHVIVDGFVLQDDTPISNVEVYPMRSYREDDSKKRYTQESSITGGYRLQFNALPNKAFELHYRKEGFSKLNRMYTFDIDSCEKQMEGLYLCHVGESYFFNFGRYKDKGDTLTGSFNSQQMLVFEEQRLNSETGLFAYDSIEYFSHILKKGVLDTTLISEKKEYSFEGDWYWVQFKYQGDDHMKRRYVLYENVIIP